MAAKITDSVETLIGACWTGDLVKIQQLLENGASVNASDADGWTPLHSSSFKGHVNVVQILLENGADIQAKDKDGQSPLHLSSEKGHLDVVECLLSHGADLEGKNNYGSTPIGLASLAGHDDMVDFLVQQGARLDDDYILNFAAKFYSADKTTKKHEIEKLVTKPELNFKGDDMSKSWSAQEKISLVRTCNTRLITAGEVMCGKTSLARSIISTTQYRSFEHDRTVVAEQRRWQVGNKTIPIIDLGGHKSYRITGMFFLSNAPNNVVLLCHDILSDRYILTYHWIRDIICHAPEAHIVPVLTRTDTLSPENVQKFKERFIEEITKFLSRDIKSLKSKLDEATRKGTENQIKKIKHVKDCYSKLVKRLPSCLLTVSTAPMQGETIEYLKKEVLLLSSKPENQLEIPEVYQAFFGKIGCIGTKVTSNVVEGNLSSSNLKETISRGATSAESDIDDNCPNTPDEFNKEESCDTSSRLGKPHPLIPTEAINDTSARMGEPHQLKTTQAIGDTSARMGEPHQLKTAQATGETSTRMGEPHQLKTAQAIGETSTRMGEPHQLKTTEAIGETSTRIGEPHELKSTESISETSARMGEPDPLKQTEAIGEISTRMGEPHQLNPEIQIPTGHQDVRTKDEKKAKTFSEITNQLSAKPYLLFEEAKLIFEETEKEMMRKPGPLQHDLRKCLSILHDLGMIMWFKGTTSLENHVFHNLKTVTRILKVVFHHETDYFLEKLSTNDTKSFANDVNQLHMHGIMTRKIMQKLLQHNQCEIEEEFVQDLLEKLNVAYKILPSKKRPSTFDIFIPYYLQDKIIPTHVIEKLEDAKLSNDGTVVLKFCFSGNITQTYFNKVLVQIYKDERLFNSLNDVWGQGVFMTLESMLCIITFDGKEEVEMIVNGLPELLPKMWEVIRKIVRDTRQLQEEWYPGLIEAFHVLCPCQHQYAILKTASTSTKHETCKLDLEQVLESQAATSPWICRNTQQLIPAAFHAVVKEGASNCEEMIQEVKTFLEKLQQGKVQVVEEWRILALTTMHPDPVVIEMFTEGCLSMEDKHRFEGLKVYDKVKLLLEKVDSDGKKEQLVTALRATNYHSNISLAQFIKGECIKENTFLSAEDHKSLIECFYKAFVGSFQSLDGVYDLLRSELDTFHEDEYETRKSTTNRAIYLLDYILLRGTIETVKLFHQAFVSRKRPELASKLSKALPNLKLGR